MTDDLENELREALRRRAAEPPRLRDSLLAGVRRRHRAHHRNGVLSVAVVLVLAAGGTASYLSQGGQDAHAGVLSAGARKAQVAAMCEDEPTRVQVKAMPPPWTLKPAKDSGRSEPYPMRGIRVGYVPPVLWDGTRETSPSSTGYNYYGHKLAGWDWGYETDWRIGGARHEIEMSIGVNCGPNITVNFLRWRFDRTDMPSIATYTVHGHRVHLYANGRREHALVVVGDHAILGVAGRGVDVRPVVRGIRFTGRTH